MNMKKTFATFISMLCIMIFSANAAAVPVTVTGGDDALTVYGFVPDTFAVELVPLNAAQSGESLTLTRAGLSNYDVCKLVCVALSASDSNWQVSIDCQDSYGMAHPAFTPLDTAMYPSGKVQDIPYIPYIRQVGGSKTSFSTGSQAINVEMQGAPTISSDTFFIGFDLEPWSDGFHALEIDYVTNFVITVTTA